MGMRNKEKGRMKTRVGQGGKDKDGGTACPVGGGKRPHKYLFFIYIPRSSALREEKGSNHSPVANKP
jgi:hypothetical protein